MSYRPQFVTAATPPGFVDEEFEYYFDQSNTPGLTPLAGGQSVNKLPLQLQTDSEFVLRALEISGNTGPLCIRLYDPFGNELSAVTVECDTAYDATLQAGNPIGRLPVPFEPEARCPAGGFLQIDILVL